MFWYWGVDSSDVTELGLCRIVTEGEKKEVWCLRVEDVSASMNTEDKEKELRMYKDVGKDPSTKTATFPFTYCI